MSTMVIEFNPSEEEKIIEQDGAPTAVVMTFERYRALLNGSAGLRARDEEIRRRSDAFKRGFELEELARQQGVGPVDKIEDLLGPVPPEEEESADEFVASIYAQREADKRWG